MKLKDSEYTITTLLEYFNSNFKKDSGRPFTKIELYKYAKRGWIPQAYGGMKIIQTEQYGITIFELQ